MQELIQSKLAYQVAQLSLNKAILEAQVEGLTEELARVQAERDQLMAELDQATAPGTEEGGNHE